MYPLMRTNTRRAMAQVDPRTLARWTTDSAPTRETESTIRKAPRQASQAEFVMVGGELVRIITGRK